MSVLGRIYWQALRSGHRRVQVLALFERRQMQPVRKFVYVHLPAWFFRYQLSDQRPRLHGELLHEQRHLHRRYQHVHVHLSSRVSIFPTFCIKAVA